MSATSDTIEPPNVAEPDHELKISVVILNYNYQAYVGDAIRSVAEQTYKNVECIVVDDGSTDGSLDVINAFSGVRVLRQKNTGQTGAARNALSYATGAIVLFLDSDDFLFEDACATIAANWRPDCSSLLYRLAIVRDGRITGENTPSQQFVRSSATAFVREYGYLPAAPTSGNAYAVDVARRIFSGSVGLEDHCFFDTWLINCAPFFGSLVMIDRCLGGYRIHGANASLAVKRTLRRLKIQAYNQYWAQRSAARFDQTVAGSTGWNFLKGPYLLKWYILTRQIAAPPFELPHQPAREIACVIECCREFLSFPGIPPSKRLLNCILVSGYWVLPSGLRQRVLKRILPQPQ